MTQNGASVQLLNVLSEKGFTPEYLSSVLPDWWDYSISQTPAGLKEFQFLLARNLGMEFGALTQDQPSVEFKLPKTKLKRRTQYNDSQLTPAMSISLSCAKIISLCARTNYQAVSGAEVLRQSLFDRGAKYISFKGLLMLCWEHGIPVIHVNHYPDGMPKMDGLVTLVNDRPVIVLSKETPFNAWMSFILAHELGHVFKGHCQPGELLVDEDIGESSRQGGVQDNDEREADEFALALLGGTTSLPLNEMIDDSFTPHDLAKQAMEFQSLNGVDAGHVLLRLAFESGDWQKSLAALQILDNQAPPIQQIVEGLDHYVDLSRVSDSSAVFLTKMMSL